MIENLWKRIIRRTPYTLYDIPAFLLWLCSFPYRWGLMWVRRRDRSRATKVAVPVVSIGNLTVGGSGKTPLVKFIASDLIAAGIRVGVVSSAYKRESDHPFLATGYDVQNMPVTETGDEVMLLAEALPEAVFSINRSKRQASVDLAATGQVDVILIDDGFQHFKLVRDLDVVAYDAGVKKRLLHWFPYGILRESLDALKRADIIIITRSRFAKDLNGIKRKLRRINSEADMYHAAFVSENLVGRDLAHSVKYLEDKSVFLFAGVGNFLALTRQVSALAGDLDGCRELSDHQEYTPELLNEIKRQVDDLESDVVITTEKDWMKIVDFDFGREFYYLDLLVDLDPGEEKLIADLLERLGLEGNPD